MAAGDGVRGVYHPSAAPKGGHEDSTKAVNDHFSESDWVRDKGRFHRYVGSPHLDLVPGDILSASNLSISPEYDAAPRNNGERVRRQFIEAALRHNIFKRHRPLLETETRIKQLEKQRWEIEWDDFERHQAIDDELERLGQAWTSHQKNYQEGLEPFLVETYSLLNPTAPSNLILPDINFPELNTNGGVWNQQQIEYNPDALAISLEACKKISKIIHRPDFKTTSVEISIANRSAFDPNTGKLEWKPSDGVQGLFHELGHVLEKNNSNTMRQAIRFLHRRTQGNSPRKLIEVYPHISNTEALYLPDRFYEEYVGRIYRYKAGKYNGEISGTEITACGIHMLLTAPHILAHADPEHFQFTYNVLQGEL